ncbi:hypothetical protein D3C80_784660 [compost metagenome]
MRAAICRVPRKLACDMGQLSPFGGKAFFTDVERHYCIAVAGDDLRTRIDEGCMHAHDRLRRLAQRQRRPLGLAKRCTAALQLSAHATVQNYHRSLCHITSLKVLMNKIHYGD